MIKSSIFLLVVLLSTINCNTLSNEGYVIKGRYINVLKTKNNPSDVKLYEICISNDSLVKILFKTEIDSLHNFGVIKLLKDSNRLIASLENYKYRQDYLVRKYDKTYIFSSDLVICNYQGTIIDTLYKSKQGEQIFHYYNSKNDKYVFFLSTEKKQQGFFCGFDNFNIYDIQNRKLIKNIYNFSNNIRLKIYDNAFDSTENNFLFCVKDGPQISIHGSTSIEIPEGDAYIKQNGIYIYNIINDTFTRILEKGYLAIWNPNNDNEILYVNDEKSSIFNYNIKTKLGKQIFQCNSEERIKYIHFTNDGKYVLITGSDHSLFSKSLCFEKLLDLSTGKIIKHKTLGFGFYDYSWR